MKTNQDLNEKERLKLANEDYDKRRSSGSCTIAEVEDAWDLKRNRLRNFRLNQAKLTPRRSEPLPVGAGHEGFQAIELSLMDDHPVNRHFLTTGQRWDDFLKSIQEKGVMQMVVVRRMPEGRFQILSGHRRVTAARLVGIETLVCDVRALDDDDALEFLVTANFDHEDLDPVEEALQVQALMGAGWTEDTIAARLRRSLRWIADRQSVLELGDEVCRAVRLPKEDDGHLHMETVRLLAKVPGELREKAIQMVLFPEIKIGVLNPREADDVLTTALLEPWKRKREWEGSAGKLEKAWRKRLGEFLTKEEKKDLIVQALSWDAVEANKARRSAEDLLWDFDLTDRDTIGADKRWLHLALANSVPVLLVPAENEAGSLAVVDESLLKLAEEAKAKHGLVTAFAVNRNPGADHKRSETRLAEDEWGPSDERVSAAEHVLDGKGEKDFADEDPPETVIDQRMESSAWVDLGPARLMREWAVKAAGNMEEWDGFYPEGVPAWIDNSHLSPVEVLAAMDWVLSLKQGAGASR